MSAEFDYADKPPPPPIRYTSHRCLLFVYLKESLEYALSGIVSYL